MNSKKAKQIRREIRKLAAEDDRIKFDPSYKAVKKLYKEGKVRITKDL